MDLNNIRRNQLDYLLTDILPNELSDCFTYSYFYDYLLENSRTIKEIVNKIKKDKAAGKELFHGNGWKSTPLKYPIKKDINSNRAISLVQPIAALEILLFIEVYQEELLNYLNKGSVFSIRVPRKNNELYYKNCSKSIVEYFSAADQSSGKEIIEQTGMFFKIEPCKSIVSFTSSEQWYSMNSKYSFFARTDYKACFDSMYTHAFTWSIGKDSVDTKQFKNSNVFTTIDHVLQNINSSRTNGIVVGPEFSRMIAELMLQSIDVEVNDHLVNKGYVKGRDYDVFRYVDDIFIFTKSEPLAETILNLFAEVSRKYLLQLNETKLFKSKVPFVLEPWVIEANAFTNKVSEMLFMNEDEQYAYINKVKDKGEEDIKPYVLKSKAVRADSQVKQSIMNQFNRMMCAFDTKQNKIVSYFLGMMLNKLGNKRREVNIFEKVTSRKVVFGLLDLLFYCYSFFPSYDNTQRLLSILYYIRDEYDFFEEKELLQKLINHYAFIFEKACLNDVVDMFLFCAQAGIDIPYITETNIQNRIEELDDPVLWAVFLLYAKGNDDYFTKLYSLFEQRLTEHIDSIQDINSILLYKEFWWIIIFVNCPFISESIRKKLEQKVKVANDSKPKKGVDYEVWTLFYKFFNNSKKQFFTWDHSDRDYLRAITFKSQAKSIFKNFRKNTMPSFWASI